MAVVVTKSALERVDLEDLISLSPTGVVNWDIYIDGVSGDDTNNSGRTKTAPLATIAGYFAKYGTNLLAGSRVRIHLAGTGGADPWETPATQQIYGVDDIDFGPCGLVGNRLVFRGPPNMLLGTPTTGPATAALDPLPGGCVICDETDVANPAGQRTRLNFTVAAPGWTAQDFGVAGQGYKLRITRAGAKVIFECPIADNGADFIILDTLGLVGVVLATDTFEIVYPAACLRGATDFGGGVRAISVSGTGAQVLDLAAPTATGQGHNFERLVFENIIVTGKFISFDRCCFIPGVTATGLQINGGSVHLVNSMAVQVGVNCINNGSIFSMGGGVAGSVPRPDNVANPINQLISIYAMVNQLNVGDDGSPGVAMIDRNLSAYGSPNDGIRLRGNAQFVQPPACLYLGGNANTGFGISANDGSTVIVQAIGGGGTATEIIGVANALQVDAHAGIAYGLGAGAFGEVAGFNGLYHDTSLAAGVTTGRMSVIRI